MDPITAGALISGGTKIFGSLLGGKSTSDTNATNLKIAQMNNEFNAAEAQKSRDFQLEMWNKENEYNTASAQRQRLEDAGLNPYLMMNGGSAGSASSVGGSAAASASGNPQMQAFRPDFSGVAEGMASFLQAKKLASETQSQDIYNQYQSDMLMAQINKMIGDTDWSKVSPDYRQFWADKGYKIAQIQESSMTQQLNNLRYTGVLTQAQAAKTLLDADSQRILNRYLDDSEQMRLQIQAAHYTNLVAEGQLTYSKCREILAHEALALAQAKGQRISNKVAESTADSLISANNAYNNAEASYNSARNGKRDYSIDAATRYHNYRLSKKSDRMYYFNQTLGQAIPIVGNAIGSKFSFPGFPEVSKPTSVFDTDYDNEGNVKRHRHREYRY